MSAPKVLFIGGWGRSGSTLLDRMLGQLPGVVSVGELRDIWQRGPIEDRRCGCGRAFSECDFWQRVGKEAFGGWDSLDLDRVAALRAGVDRVSAVPLLLRPGARETYRRDLAEYTALLDRLYAGIAAVSEATTIVDSSKIPVYALVLRHAAVDMRVLHLVRDSRGVLYSWQKQVERPDATTTRDFMLRYGVAMGCARYVGYNAMTELLRLLGVPYRRVRYEDVIAAPWDRLSEVAAYAGVQPDPALEPVLRAGEVPLEVNHTVDGNPIRFQVGTIKLRLDDAWRRSMPRRKQRLITGLTAPLLLRYRYLGSR